MRISRPALLFCAGAVLLGGVSAFRVQPAPSPTIALLVTTGPNWDKAKAPGEQRHFKAHSDNLRRLRDAGVIVAGGRFSEYGLILVRAPSVDSAMSMMKPDSSIAVGTFNVTASRWSTIYEGMIGR
jgi:hypothetical protein